MKRKKQRDLTEKTILPETESTESSADETLPLLRFPPESGPNIIRPAVEVEREIAEELRKCAENARLEREERRRAAMARFIETGEGLPNWITVHRRGSLNTVAVQHIRNVFPYEIETDEGKTLTRIAFVAGAVLDVDESPEEVREAIWKSGNFMDFCPDEMYREVCL